MGPKTIKIRKNFGITFTVISLSLLVILFGARWSIWVDDILPIVWCGIWALFGMGLGLILTRKEGSKQAKQYIFYYGVFLLFVATYFSYGFGFLGTKIQPEWTNGYYPTKSWFTSSVIAFLAGLSGDVLFGFLRKFNIVDKL